jgi:hypothetical protein
MTSSTTPTKASSSGPFLVFSAPLTSLLELSSPGRVERRRPAPVERTSSDRSRGSADARSLRPCPYAGAFHAVLSRVEEALAGERPAVDPVTAVALIDRLQELTRSTAPRRVRAASTLADLHAALLGWQDRLEVRDGRRPQGTLLRLA